MKAIADSQEKNADLQVRSFNRLQKDLASISDDVAVIHGRLSELDLDKKILSNLSFPEIKVRQDKISPAHQKTFNWVFEEDKRDPSKPSVLLLPFLRDSSWDASADWRKRVYWIGGKAGSGKSVLMKFLCDHEKTMAALNEWSAGYDLITANFFFWNTASGLNDGYELQKSQEGLLRTLLFQILRSCPDLVSEAFSERRKQTSTTKWSLNELLNALKRVRGKLDKKTRFCFFIDGLDEYYGDTSHLLQLVEELAGSENVKLCVSSRPWPQFMRAFNQDQDRRLHVHLLTREDIAKYTKDHLESNATFQTRKEQEPAYQMLVTEIVSRADGVFFWVFLVVRSLLHGLTNKDTPEHLIQRLRQLPTELDPFFDHMMKTVDPIYAQKMAQTFLIAMESKHPLPVIVYYSMDDSESQPLLSAWNGTNKGIEEIPGSKLLLELSVSAVESEMSTRIAARTKGLLEINEGPLQSKFPVKRVDFIHRTVAEFLRQPDKLKELRCKSASDNFQPLTMIAQGNIHTLQKFSYHDLGGISGLTQVVEDSLYYVRESGIREQQSTIDLIDWLESVLASKYPPLLTDAHDGTTIGGDLLLTTTLEARFALKQRREPCTSAVNQRESESSLFERCVEYGITDFVQQKLDERPGILQFDWSKPLLTHALCPSPSMRYPPPDLTSMIKLLLERGANPRNDGGRAWRQFAVNVLLDRHSSPYSGPSISPQKAQDSDLIQLLLDHNADPNLLVDDNQSRTHQTLFGIMVGITYSPTDLHLWQKRLGWIESSLRHGADPNLPAAAGLKGSIWTNRLRVLYEGKNYKTDTPLYRKFHAQEVKLFIENSADLYAKLPIVLPSDKVVVKRVTRAKYEPTVEWTIYNIFPLDLASNLCKTIEERRLQSPVHRFLLAVFGTMSGR
jgi:hypothetical protein